MGVRAFTQIVLTGLCFSLTTFAYAEEPIKCAFTPVGGSLDKNIIDAACISKLVDETVTPINDNIDDLVVKNAEPIEIKKAKDVIAFRVQNDLKTQIKSAIATKGTSAVLANHTSERSVVIEAAQSCFDKQRAYRVKKQYGGQDSTPGITLTQENAVILLKLQPSLSSDESSQDLLMIERTSQPELAPEIFSAYWDEAKHALATKGGFNEEQFAQESHHNTTIITLTCAG